MIRDFDELVRDSMTWFTDGVDMPTSIAAEARRHNLLRRRTRIGWIASAAAIAGATAVALAVAAAGTVPQHHGGQRGGSPPVLTAAVVVNRVEHAIASVEVGKPVAFTRQTTRGVKIYVAIPHGRPHAIDAGVISTWSRGSFRHVVLTTRAGKTALSMATDNSAGRSAETFVSYPQRVWWRGVYQAPGTPRPRLACTLGQVDRTPAQWAREVRKLLSCGAAVAGHQRVDGVETVRLRLSSSYRRACVAANDGRRCRPQPVSWSGILWANARTYLPVRLASHGRHYGFQIDFRWLPPTAANLARLHLSIPAGFRRV